MEGSNKQGGNEGFCAEWKQGDEVLLNGLNEEIKSEQIEEAGKRAVGGVRNLPQGAMSLTQTLEGGLNHPPTPSSNRPVFCFFCLWASCFYLFPLPLQTYQTKEKPQRCSFFSIEPFTSVWGLDIKCMPVLQSCHLSNVLELYNYIGCLTKSFYPHNPRWYTRHSLGKKSGRGSCTYTQAVYTVSH